MAQGSLPLSKACEVEDFVEPELSGLLRELFPYEGGRFRGFPIGWEYRKHWEIAMAIRSLRNGAAVGPGRQVLGVGAGNEPTIFLLTREVDRVFATDLYLGEQWQESADHSMLADPGVHWPFAWCPRRLVVQHMDALDLRYEDGSFDGIFSSSSLEHFGDHDAIRQSIDEMYRVLRPGGVLSLSTELRLAGPDPGIPDTLLFTPSEIETLIVDRHDWAPLDGGADFGVSEATRAASCDFEAAAADVRSHVATHGRLVFHQLRWSTYPHVVLTWRDWTWTSVHLALRKPA